MGVDNASPVVSTTMPRSFQQVAPSPGPGFHTFRSTPGGATVAAMPYSATEMGNLPNIQGVSGNTVYAVPGNMDTIWTDELSVMEFPRETLKFVQKLGEGQFGEVTGNE